MWQTQLATLKLVLTWPYVQSLVQFFQWWATMKCDENPHHFISPIDGTCARCVHAADLCTIRSTAFNVLLYNICAGFIIEKHRMCLDTVCNIRWHTYIKDCMYTLICLNKSPMQMVICDPNSARKLPTNKLHIDTPKKKKVKKTTFLCYVANKSIDRSPVLP